MFGRISSSFLNALKLDYQQPGEGSWPYTPRGGGFCTSNFVEYRPETTYHPVCNVWGLFLPFINKILIKGF
jgi:hypothetical protein